MTQFYVRDVDGTMIGIVPVRERADVSFSLAEGGRRGLRISGVDIRGIHPAAPSWPATVARRAAGSPRQPPAHAGQAHADWIRPLWGSLKQSAHLPMNLTMDESRYRNAITIRPRHPRSIRGIGNAVIALLAAQVLALFFEAVAVLREMSLLQRIIDGGPVTLTEATASDNRVAASARLWLALLVVTIVLWLIWQHRAHTNLEALGAFGLEYSPRWAVGWWLIPIANLWKPYQVNRELWKASGSVNDRLSLLTWPVLGWWWASWILAGVLGRVVAAARNGADTPMELRSADILDLVLIAEVIASAVLAILVVRSVVARQDRLASAVPPLPKPPAPEMPRPDRPA
jgi:Domain of unknown function (DUF4328)